MGGHAMASAPPSSGDPREGPLVVVLPDPESVALAVATAVVSEAHRAVDRSGRFTLSLSGGSTPRRAYELLGRTPFADDIPWDFTDIFWGDERCVSPDDPRSNESMARAAMLDHVPIPADQVHPMRCPGIGGSEAEASDAAMAADEAAIDYETLLRGQVSALDLVLLGLGKDGHTASLFPGSDALREKERWVAPARQSVESGGAGAGDTGGTGGAKGEAPLWRVTLTAPYINRAAAVFFIVYGADKAGVLRQVLEGDTSGADGGAGLPAQSISPTGGKLVWFVDEEAASQLDRGKYPRKERGWPR